MMTIKSIFFSIFFIIAYSPIAGITLLIVILYVFAVITFMVLHVVLRTYKTNFLRHAWKTLSILLIPMLIITYFNPLLNSAWIGAIKKITKNEQICKFMSDWLKNKCSKPEETKDCNIFKWMQFTADYDKCIVAKAERENDPNLCELIHKSNTSRFSCVGGFIWTQAWKNICNEWLMGRYNKLGLLTWRCLTEDNVDKITINWIIKWGKKLNITYPIWFNSIKGPLYIEKKGTKTWLKSINSNPNTTNSQWMTALVHLLNYSTYFPGIDKQDIKNMIEFGIDPNIKDKLGHDALYYAENNPSIKDEVKQYLRELKK